MYQYQKSQQSKVKSPKDRDKEQENSKYGNNLKNNKKQIEQRRNKLVNFYYEEIANQKYLELYISVNQQYQETLIILEVDI